MFSFDFSLLFPEDLSASLLGKALSAELSSVAQNPWASSSRRRFVKEEKYNGPEGGSSNLFLPWLKVRVGLPLKNGARKGETAG